MMDTPEKITPKRPDWAVYERPVTNEKGRVLRPGVYWHSYKQTAFDENDDLKDHADRLISDEWIASPITVIARTINNDTGGAGRLLRVVTDSGIKELIIAMEVFGGSGEEARRPLFAMGAIIAPNKRGKFTEYLLDQHPYEVIVTTSRPGWHESGAFILPGSTIGNTNVRYQASHYAQLLYSRKGELKMWQREVATRCAGNPVLTLAVCAALSGPLLSLVNILGGGLHFMGDSSSGKTLALQAAASVWGNPIRFVASWDVTPGGLEIEASDRNDTVLPLDEIKRADPRRVQEMAYCLANGIGKSTMTREREGRAKLSWRHLTLSSGERSLSDHAAISGNSAHAGAELRMIDVNAGTRKYRAFDELHGLDGAAFHHSLSVAVGSHYGHLGPAFIEMLLASRDFAALPKEFADLRAGFVTENAQAGRVADRFSVIALAGELAIEFGLLPWKAGSVTADCGLLYGEWLSQVGNGNTEDRQIVASVQDYIDRHGSSRFSDVKDKKTDTKVINRAGYWEDTSTNRLYLFHKSALAEAARGYSLTRIVKALEQAKILAFSDHDRKTKNYRLPGGAQARLYVVDPEAISCQGEEGSTQKSERS
jgi:uncharacterized protein (DUF927 family)